MEFINMVQPNKAPFLNSFFHPEKKIDRAINISLVVLEIFGIISLVSLILIGKIELFEIDNLEQITYGVGGAVAGLTAITIGKAILNPNKARSAEPQQQLDEVRQTSSMHNNILRLEPQQQLGEVRQTSSMHNNMLRLTFSSQKQKVSLVQQKTRGDGSCTLHALLGAPDESNKYILANPQQARNELTERINHLRSNQINNRTENDILLLQKFDSYCRYRKENAEIVLDEIKNINSWLDQDQFVLFGIYHRIEIVFVLNLPPPNNYTRHLLTPYPLETDSAGFDLDFIQLEPIPSEQPKNRSLFEHRVYLLTVGNHTSRMILECDQP
jgi:hypothetical protein